LLENKCTVIVSSSNSERVQKAVESLKQSYPSASGRISGYACNLGDQATIEDNIKQLFEKVGELDHVIFTAGDPLAATPIDDVNMDKMVKAGMVRFFAPLFVGKYAPKYLKGGRESSITFTTGAVSERPIGNWSLIGSFATGLHGMTRGLALDLKPIRVNLVSPGAVVTELWNHMTEQQRSQYFKSVEEKLPTGKVGQVTDVVESYLYALKDQNLTGSMISTNGGHLLV